MATVLNHNDDPPLVERLDRVLTELRAGEKAWAETPLAGRAQMLSAVHRLVVAHAADWVDAAVAIKGLDPSPLVGEEWISGPWVTATNAATLAHALGGLARGRSPLRAARFGTAPGGRTTVQVLPTSVWDRLLLNGYSAEVWLEPGVTADEARLAAGLAQRTPARTGGIGLVLGAGNITSIAPLDVLYELIAHNRVVVLKPNPITDPLVPVWELVLAPLIDAGVLRIVMGEPTSGRR
jgi:aldehyde dehydrogenase (NAD(P)+)